MHVEFLSHWSGNLGQEMNVNRYGHAGIPVVVMNGSDTKKIYNVLNGESIGTRFLP